MVLKQRMSWRGNDNQRHRSWFYKVYSSSLWSRSSWGVSSERRSSSRRYIWQAGFCHQRQCLISPKINHVPRRPRKVPNYNVNPLACKLVCVENKERGILNVKIISTLSVCRKFGRWGKCADMAHLAGNNNNNS